jgi:transcriptional regulator with XRE-family HTH domain
MRPLFEAMVEQRLTVGDVADAAGVTQASVFRWAQGECPTLLNAEAALNALGCRLVVTRMTRGELIEQLGERRALTIMRSRRWK